MQSRESASLHQWISCGFFRALVLLNVLLFLTYGCTHLQNRESADLAKEISSNFKTFGESSTSPYSLMLQNQQKVELRASQRQAEIAKQRASSFSAQVHTVTWSGIKAELESEQRQMAKRDNDLKEAIANLLKEKGEMEATVTKTEEGLKKAQSLLKNAVEEQEKWNARQVLFRSTIKFLADTTANKEKKLDLQTLEDEKKKILDQKVKIETLNEKGDLVAQDRTLNDLLVGDKADLKKLDFGGLLQHYSVGIFEPESAPGLTVTILGLGMDLAEVQRDRAKLEVNYLKGRIDALAAQQDGSSNINEALTIIEDRTREGSFVRTDSVLQTINQLRRRSGTERAIRDAFRVIIYYSRMQTLDESARLELQIQPAILEHEYSIRLSKINAREHEALISRGLESLKIYHESGVSQEMVANWLRLAQAVALAVISVGVW